jgi:hypothetical protein
LEKKRLSPPTTPPKIEVNLAFKSTWNYQSLHVQLGLTDEVRAEETVEQALTRIYDWVESHMLEKTESTKKEVEQIYVKKVSTRSK